MRRRGVMRWICTVLFLSFSLWGCEEKIKPSVLPGIDSQTIPQQESWNSTIALSDSGQLKALIQSGYIQKYDEPREILLREGVTVFFYDDEQRHTSTLTSREGKVDELTNNLEAHGNVVVISQESTRLQTEKLYWDNGRRLIHTPEYVSIVSPREQVQGKGFESDQQLRNYRIFRVTGRTTTPSSSR